MGRDSKKQDKPHTQSTNLLKNANAHINNINPPYELSMKLNKDLLQNY